EEAKETNASGTELPGDPRFLTGPANDYFTMRTQWIPSLYGLGKFDTAAQYFEEFLNKLSTLQDEHKKNELRDKIMKLGHDLAKYGPAESILKMCQHLKVHELSIYLADILVARIKRDKNLPPVPDFAAKSNLVELLDRSNDDSINFGK